MNGSYSPSPVSLQYTAPPEDLRNHFGSLYLFRSDLPEYSDVTRADFAQLRLMLTGNGNYYFSDGNVRPTPGACLLGPTQGATRFHLHAPAMVVGISLLPLGWIALTGLDADDYTDGLADMTSISEEYSELQDELRASGASDAAAVGAIIWPFLRTRLTEISGHVRQFLDDVDQWLAGDESPQVDALAEKTNLSPRQVARLTNRYYGAAPKQLARKFRALRCAAKIAIDQTPWQELCDDSTFYDQSHFIREIKHFIGLTPHQLMTSPTEVARLTLQRRELLHNAAPIQRIS